jgi:hypothetical protein
MGINIIDTSGSLHFLLRCILQSGYRYTYNFGGYWAIRLGLNRHVYLFSEVAGLHLDYITQFKMINFHVWT